MKNLFLIIMLISISACSPKPENEQAAAADRMKSMQEGFNASKPKTLPKLDTSKKTYKKLDLYNTPSKSAD